MITEKDLEVEFHRETGLHRKREDGIFTSHPEKFNQWCLEKLLEYKNNEG